MSLLLPKVCFLPLTISTLNTVDFVPRKDYTTNRLNTGILQLSDGSHLVVDETALETGKLEAQGLYNNQPRKASY